MIATPLTSIIVSPAVTRLSDAAGTPIEESARTRRADRTYRQAQSRAKRWRAPVQLALCHAPAALVVFPCRRAPASRAAEIDRTTTLVVPNGTNDKPRAQRARRSERARRAIRIRARPGLYLRCKTSSRSEE